jgi:hypothetical protein
MGNPDNMDNSPDWPLPATDSPSVLPILPAEDPSAVRFLFDLPFDLSYAKACETLRGVGRLIRFQFTMENGETHIVENPSEDLIRWVAMRYKKYAAAPSIKDD